MKQWFLCILLLGALLLTACQATTTPAGSVGSDKVGRPVAVAGGTYQNITPPELKGMVAKKDFYFVNVHIPFEGNIANTDASIPYNEIEQNLARLPSDKNAKIVLYCRSGRMSEIAAETLIKRGYTNLWNLDGGMIAWEKAGLPIESK